MASVTPIDGANPSTPNSVCGKSNCRFSVYTFNTRTSREVCSILRRNCLHPQAPAILAASILHVMIASHSHSNLCWNIFPAHLCKRALRQLTSRCSPDGRVHLFIRIRMLQNLSSAHNVDTIRTWLSQLYCGDV